MTSINHSYCQQHAAIRNNRNNKNSRMHYHLSWQTRRKHAPSGSLSACCGSCSRCFLFIPLGCSPAAAIATAVKFTTSRRYLASVSFRPSFRPSICPSVHPSVRPSASQSVSPSFRPFVRLSVRPSFRPSVCQSVRPSFRPFVHLSDRPSVRPSVRPLLSVRPSVIPSICPFVRPPVSVHSSIHPSVTPSICPSVRPSFGWLVSVRKDCNAGGRVDTPNVA